MVNSSVLISATITLAAVICGVVIFSMENPNAVNMSNSEPLGAKSKWLIMWGKERLMQSFTIDLSDGKPTILVETVEGPWKDTFFFAENKMTYFEGMSPEMVFSMCDVYKDELEDWASCISLHAEKMENCQESDADLSHMVGADHVNKPIENGIRRTRRRVLREMSLSSRKLQTDEEKADLEADLASSGLSEEEKQAIRDCVMSGSAECEESVAADHEDPFDEEESGALLPVTLGNGEVVENAIIIGNYLVQLDEDSVPVKIISGSDGHVLADVVGIFPLNSNDEVRLKADWSCEGEERRALQEQRSKKRLTRRLGEEGARKLFDSIGEEVSKERKLQTGDTYTGFDDVTYSGAVGRSAVSLSPYGWCGPGTKVDGSTPCPHDMDMLQYACRRHDLGKKGYAAVVNKIVLYEVAILVVNILMQAPLILIEAADHIKFSIIGVILGINDVYKGNSDGENWLDNTIGDNAAEASWVIPGRSCGQDYDLAKLAAGCTGTACDHQLDPVFGLFHLHTVLAATYGDNSLSGTVSGCRDKAITNNKNGPQVLVTTGHNGAAHWHNKGTHCHGGWTNCGWRGCRWNGCKKRETNHNQEYHDGHNAWVVDYVKFDIVERMYFGESRFTCTISNGLGVNPYESNDMLFETKIKNLIGVSEAVADFFTGLFSRGEIVFPPDKAIDYKPACYSHYRNRDGDAATAVMNAHGDVNRNGEDIVTDGFKLDVESDGSFKNSGVVNGVSYSHYNSPHFHNYGYNKAGDGCSHTDIGGTAGPCPTACFNDAHFFAHCGSNVNPLEATDNDGKSWGPNGSGMPQNGQCNTWN